METRIYENGVLQGKAVKQSTSAEVEERNYVDGKLNGKATVLYPDSSKEMRTYKVRTEKATGESGETIIFLCAGQQADRPSIIVLGLWRENRV